MRMTVGLCVVGFAVILCGCDNADAPKPKGSGTMADKAKEGLDKAKEAAKEGIDKAKELGKEGVEKAKELGGGEDEDAPKDKAAAPQTADVEEAATEGEEKPLKYPVMFRSADAGVTWSPVKIPVGESSLSSVACPTPHSSAHSPRHVPTWLTSSHE